MSADTTFTFTQNQEAKQQAGYEHYQSLRHCVERVIADYFNDLDGQHCTDLYELVLQEVEAPLFAAVMQYTGNNQSKAAEILSLNRGTLRKKLKSYDLL